MPNISVDRSDIDLWSAAYHGCVDEVERLVDAGADIDGSGIVRDPLVAAANQGHEVIVKLLIEAGANVNYQAGLDGNALEAAAFEGHEEILKVLIEAGANFNYQAGHYGNALAAAAYGGHEEILNTLIEAGANVNDQGGVFGSALHAAIIKNEIKTVKMLLEHQASINSESRTYNNSTMLHSAVALDNCAILKLLLDNGAGAFINIKNSSGQNPIHLAVDPRNHGSDVKFLELLLPHINDPALTYNEKDLDGRTPLHLVVEGNDTKIIEMLLDGDANPNTPDDGDITPFQRAFQLGRFDFVCLLLPRMAKNLNLISASKWRSISSANKNKNIIMTDSMPENIKTFSNEQLDSCLSDRAYSLDSTALRLNVYTKSMAERALEARIL